MTLLCRHLDLNRTSKYLYNYLNGHRVRFFKGYKYQLFGNTRPLDMTLYKTSMKNGRGITTSPCPSEKLPPTESPPTATGWRRSSNPPQRRWGYLGISPAPSNKSWLQVCGWKTAPSSDGHESSEDQTGGAIHVHDVLTFAVSEQTIPGSLLDERAPRSWPHSGHAARSKCNSTPL